jgi:hypothetical protein
MLQSWGNRSGGRSGSVGSAIYLYTWLFTANHTDHG